jgi:hypothetical protein
MSLFLWCAAKIWHGDGSCAIRVWCWSHHISSHVCHVGIIEWSRLIKLSWDIIEYHAIYTKFHEKSFICYRVTVKWHTRADTDTHRQTQMHRKTQTQTCIRTYINNSAWWDFRLSQWWVWTFSSSGDVALCSVVQTDWCYSDDAGSNTSEMPVSFFQNTWCNISEDCHLQDLCSCFRHLQISHLGKNGD